MYTIEDFRENNKAENIIISMQGQMRMHEKGLTIGDVMSVIDSGEIVEEYPDEFPFESCLIMGWSVDGKYMQIVLSMNENNIYLILVHTVQEMMMAEG